MYVIETHKQSLIDFIIIRLFDFFSTFSQLLKFFVSQTALKIPVGGNSRSSKQSQYQDLGIRFISELVSYQCEWSAVKQAELPELSF